MLDLIFCVRWDNGGNLFLGMDNGDHMFLFFHKYDH